MEIVGRILFDGNNLDVYDSLDQPYFLAQDIAKLIDYSVGKTGQMLETLEKDEYLTDIQHRSGQKRHVYMITELGLYNILSQSRKPIARKWRRIVHSNLIMLRKQNKLTIEGQFKEWDAIADNLFIDPETGILMEFNTVPGGDVEVHPYEE
jgi:prophage antirepressor-like protein